MSKSSFRKCLWSASTSHFRDYLKHKISTVLLINCTCCNTNMHKLTAAIYLTHPIHLSLTRCRGLLSFCITYSVNTKSLNLVAPFQAPPTPPISTAFSSFATPGSYSIPLTYIDTSKQPLINLQSLLDPA